jgi:glutathione reductase (NADPH)
VSGYDFDLFVIGGGSGGVRAARMTAGLGRRVGIAEEYRFGGTCVIRGCVPKKLLVYAAHFHESFQDAAGFGWKIDSAVFDWPSLIAAKDKEIARLEAAYRGGVEKAGGTIFAERAVISGPHEIHLPRSGKAVTAERILIATGGSPFRMPELPGHELCITSNEAFHLSELPASIVIYGGSYIAVEFAGIFAGLGSKVTLVCRSKQILRGFDEDLGGELMKAMRAKGIDVRSDTLIESIGQTAKGRRVKLSSGSQIEAAVVMLATGRKANIAGLGLENAGLETAGASHLQVDRYSRTRVPHILAVGDVTARMALTPVAIHEAMCLVETEFKGNPTSPDHELVATAVFAQPEIGTIGLSEAAAAAKYPSIHIYRVLFRPMKHTLSGRDEKMMMKLVVDGRSDRVLGVHILGEGAAEIVQSLAVAIKMGARKSDFDRTMAVHPTAGEELVTMYQPSYRIENGERAG